MDTKALRQKILDLAIRGKLVPQDPNDEPASVLLERIHAEKQQMVKDGKLKAKDIKNDTVIFKGDDNLHYEQFHEGTVKCIEDEIPFVLPVGWKWTRLYHISEIVTGSTPSKKISEYYGGDFPFFKPADLEQRDNVFQASEYLSNKGKNASRIIPSGSTAVCCIGSIGKCGYLRKDGTTNQQINSVIPYINKKYMYYYCSTNLFVSQLIKESSATTISIVNKKKMSNITVPLPPLQEQHRIVTQLNEIFAFVDKIDSDKSDLQSTIQFTKSKILDLAIRGKLVPQDPNDEPASVLLERIRAEKEELIKQGKIKRNKKESVIFKGDDNSYYEDLPVNWSVSSLSEITTNLILNDGDWILSDNMVPSGEIKLIQLGSVGFLEYVNKGFKYLTPEIFNELGCTEIHSGYMLINRIVSNKMCACILPKIEGKKITTVDTCWISPKDDWYNLKYILYAISSPLFQSFVMINSSGTTRKRISKSNLVSLPLAFPPLAEQKRIVEAIEVAFTKLDEITNSIL